MFTKHHAVKRLGVHQLFLAVFAFVLICAAVLTNGPASPTMAALTYKNAVFTKDFPDPMVLRINKHDYYAYGTSTSWERGYFPILHSSDLVHWKYVGDMFKLTNAPRWTDNDLWAPSVIHRGKTYYAYYGGHGVVSNTHCVAVATASKPTGPFKHRAILGCSDASGRGYIDPSVYVDTSGKAYLYVSVDDPQHTISVIPLKKDLLHVAGSRQLLFGITQAWEHGANFSTVEGPYLIKHGDLYYLFYSGNDWRGGYSMGYATGKSPVGPFSKCSCNPVLTGNSKVHGPGGGSVVQGPDGNLWMVYHAWPGAEGYDHNGIRTMRIDPLVWHGDVVSVSVSPQ